MTLHIVQINKLQVLLTFMDSLQKGFQPPKVQAYVLKCFQRDQIVLHIA